MKPSAPSGCLIAIALLFPMAHPADAINRTVTNLNDSGAGSLRDAIVASADGDTINFSVYRAMASIAGGEVAQLP